MALRSYPKVPMPLSFWVWVYKGEFFGASFIAVPRMANPVTGAQSWLQYGFMI